MSQYVTTPDGKRHKFPDEASPEQIKAALSGAALGGKPILIPPSESYPEPRAMKATSPFISRGLEMLPYAGGYAGGFLGSVGGPPGMVGGATLGGSIGESMKQGIEGKQFSPLAIGGRGLEQGLWELSGLGLAKGAGKLAAPLMQHSLGIVSSLAKRFRMTPEAIAKAVLSERYPITLAGEQTAKAATESAINARNAVIRSTGGNISAKGLARVALRDAEESLGRPLTQAERGKLVSTVQAEADAILTGRTHGAVPKAGLGRPAQPASTMLNQFGQPALPAQPAIPSAPSRYSPWEVEQIKEVAAKNARPAYRADQAGLGIAADPTLSKQLAGAARARINKIPGMKERNVRLKSLSAAQQAVSDALMKTSGGTLNVGHIGPLSLGVKLPRKKTADLALLLANPRFQRLLKRSPRAGAALIQQMVHTAEPDQTNALR